MRARGPDGSGVWWSSDRRCGLGHRRLSILDLSDRASQPMASVDGKIVVTFNGEIYNYKALRAELEAAGVRFRTSSDTEALLHLYARHGATMVHRLRGMFAFAIWDETRRELFLARDAYGIKRSTPQTTAGHSVLPPKSRHCSRATRYLEIRSRQALSASIYSAACPNHSRSTATFALCRLGTPSGSTGRVRASLGLSPKWPQSWQQAQQTAPPPPNWASVCAPPCATASAPTSWRTVEVGTFFLQVSPPASRPDGGGWPG